LRAENPPFCWEANVKNQILPAADMLLPATIPMNLKVQFQWSVCVVVSWALNPTFSNYLFGLWISIQIIISKLWLNVGYVFRICLTNTGLKILFAIVNSFENPVSLDDFTRMLSFKRSLNARLVNVSEKKIDSSG